MYYDVCCGGFWDEVNLNYMPWLGERYACKDCGYQGALTVENGEIAEGIRKKFETKDKEE